MAEAGAGISSTGSGGRTPRTKDGGIRRAVLWCAQPHTLEDRMPASTTLTVRLTPAVKQQLGRLVVDNTVRVTGKVLTPEDHQRISEETAREVAA